MPRITPLRVVLSPFLCYIFLVFTFVAVPSIPSVSGSNYSSYFQDVLRAGEQLTTVYENKWFYRSPLNIENREREYFAVDWRLVPDVEHNSITLHVGTNASVNLTSLTHVHTPYLSPEAIVVSTRAGDTDGVMLPWFEPADAALMNWDIERDPKIMEMRVIVMFEGVVQIWPESPRGYPEPLEPPSTIDSDLNPFLTITKIPTMGDKSDVSHIEVDDMTWSVPTMTFPIRRFILITLKPITLFTIEVIGPIILVFFAIVQFAINLALVGAGITLGCWWSCGRPPFDDWARNFFLTRWMYNKLDLKISRSPSMDIEAGSESQGHDSSVRGGPQPLRCVVDFFRSSSPLDDLLITFESTRWLLEPLGSHASPTERRFEPSDGVTTSDVGEEKPKVVG